LQIGYRQISYRRLTTKLYSLQAALFAGMIRAQARAVGARTPPASRVTARR